MDFSIVDVVARLANEQRVPICICALAGICRVVDRHFFRRDPSAWAIPLADRNELLLDVYGSDEI